MPLKSDDVAILEGYTRYYAHIQGLLPDSERQVARLDWWQSKEECRDLPTKRSTMFIEKGTVVETISRSDHRSTMHILRLTEADQGQAKQRTTEFAMTSQDNVKEWHGKINMILQNRLNRPAPVPPPARHGGDLDEPDSYCEFNNAYDSQATGVTFNVKVLATEIATQYQFGGEPCQLEVLDENITLRKNADHQHKLVWSYRHIRRFGIAQNSVTIETGNRSETGSGTFKFQTGDAQVLFDCIQKNAKAASAKKKRQDESSQDSLGHGTPPLPHRTPQTADTQPPVPQKSQEALLDMPVRAPAVVKTRSVDKPDVPTKPKNIPKSPVEKPSPWRPGYPLPAGRKDLPQNKVSTKQDYELAQAQYTDQGDEPYQDPTDGKPVLALAGRGVPVLPSNKPPSSDAKKVSPRAERAANGYVAKGGSQDNKLPPETKWCQMVNQVKQGEGSEVKVAPPPVKPARNKAPNRQLSADKMAAAAHAPKDPVYSQAYDHHQPAGGSADDVYALRLHQGEGAGETARPSKVLSTIKKTLTRTASEDLDGEYDHLSLRAPARRNSLPGNGGVYAVAPPQLEYDEVGNDYVQVSDGKRTAGDDATYAEVRDMTSQRGMPARKTSLPNKTKAGVLRDKVTNLFRRK